MTVEDPSDLIRGMFDHPGLRLANVQRYSTVPTIHKESVAEHSYFVALFAWEVASFIGADTGQTVRIAIAHDLDEAFSGDMPRPFKYREAVLKLWLNGVCRDAMLDAFGEDSHVYDAWEDSKDKSLEAQIVKFSDLLTCLLFAYRERHLGSTTFANQVLDRGPLNFGSIEWDRRIQPLVDELVLFAGRNYT